MEMNLKVNTTTGTDQALSGVRMKYLKTNK